MGSQLCVSDLVYTKLWIFWLCVCACTYTGEEWKVEWNVCGPFAREWSGDWLYHQSTNWTASSESWANGKPSTFLLFRACDRLANLWTLTLTTPHRFNAHKLTLLLFPSLHLSLSPFLSVPQPSFNTCRQQVHQLALQLKYRLFPVSLRLLVRLHHRLNLSFQAMGHFNYRKIHSR